MSEQFVPTYKAATFGVQMPGCENSSHLDMFYRPSVESLLDEPLHFKRRWDYFNLEEFRERRQKAQERSYKAAETRRVNARARREAKVRAERGFAATQIRSTRGRCIPLQSAFVSGIFPREIHTVYVKEHIATQVANNIRRRGFVRVGVGRWTMPMGRVRAICFYDMNFWCFDERLFKVTAELA